MTPDAPSPSVAKDSAGTSRGASRIRDARAAAPAGAFDWHPFAEGLRRFVARRVPERDAEDVAQDVLLRLHQSASTLRDAGRAEAWVYGVARRTIADYFRASGGRSAGAALGAGGLDPGELPDPDAPAARGFGSFRGDHDVHEEVLSWLRPTAEELPDGYREALLLADFEGRGQREVAAELGLSLSGAKSRVQRARKMLADRLLDCCELALGPDGRVEDFKRRDPCDC